MVHYPVQDKATDDRRRAHRERLLRLLLPRQLHEERLVQEVAEERMAQPPQRAGGEQRPMGEAPGSDTAPPGGSTLAIRPSLGT